MSSDTKFYTPVKPSFNEIMIVFKLEFEDVKVISDNDKKENRFVRVYLTYKGVERMMWIFFDSPDFDENKPHTCFDLGAYSNSVEIMQIIAKYFGGWLIENGCNDNIKPYYIENNLTIDKKNSDYLYEALAKEFSYKDTEKLCKFIQENKKLITDLNFGLE